MSTSKDFQRDGYVVIPNLLSAGEIASLRADVERELERKGMSFGLGSVIPNAASESAALVRLYTHPQIVAAVRDVLADERIVFTMESGIHRNVTGPWHKDLGTHAMAGGYYGTDQVYERDDCRVVKVAIYLQDQPADRSLKVRRGSHVMASLVDGEEIALVSRAGDVAIFDARITHRGLAPQPFDGLIASVARVLPRRHRGRAVASTRRWVNRVKHRPDRLAVYLAFGPDNAMTATYAARNLARELEQVGKDAAPLDDVVLAAFRACGVRVLAGA